MQPIFVSLLNGSLQEALRDIVKDTLWKTSSSRGGGGGYEGYEHYRIGPKINPLPQKYPSWDQYKYNLFLQFYFTQ